VYRRILERTRAAGIASVRSCRSATTEERRVRKLGDGAAGIPNRDDTEGATVNYGSGPSSPSGDDRAGFSASFYVIGRDYFRALGIPIVRGRSFTDAEELSGGGARVAVIDEPLAKRLFPGGDPLGQNIYFPGREEADTRPLEIIGIVRGTRHSLFDRDPAACLPFVALPAT
jgi:hypothetical protein